MPQFQTVVLKDNSGADHTFAPRDITSGVVNLAESTGVPIADRRLSASVTRTGQGRRKLTFKMAIPVVQDSVINGVSRPTVTRSAYADVTLSFDETSSKAEREDLRSFVSELFGPAAKQPMIAKFIGDLEGIF